MYQGSSIVDYLNQTGQASDFASRAKLAASRGITGYSGSAQQNTQLLNMLRGNAQQQQPQAQPAKPQGTPQAPAGVSAGSPAPTQQGTPGQPASAQDLVAMGYYGYQGWDDTSALGDFRSTGGSGKGGPSQGGANFSGITTMPTINLPQLYQSLYDSSGISQIESELSTKAKAYTDAVSKIKDNPYLSEARMSGRLKKLDERFNADTANLRNDIATKKADIETKLNLETKQFDIQSNQAKQAWDQFNSLLSAGALSNASGEDIANITRSTGISSNMIYAAINAQKKKDVQTQVIQVDDGKTISAVVIDQNTGNIINKTPLSASKPAAAKQASETEKTQYYQNNLRQDVSGGVTLKDVFKIYGGILDPNTIYNLYNINSPYGPAKEDQSELTQYGVKFTGSTL